jgi:hypothetical protein
MSFDLTNLDLIQIASPCPAPWDSMVGDERARFCAQCKLHVYNLREMSHEDALSFIQHREGRTCVQFFRREDGKVLTRDCPVGVRALKQRFVRAVSAIAALFVAVVSATMFGEIFQRKWPIGMRTPFEAFSYWIDPTPRWITGVVTCPVVPPIVPPSNVLTGELVEPAETPLMEPTAEQKLEIQRRLEN